MIVEEDFMTRIKYRLGLDLGATSIGWALYDIENEKIIDLGVRIFDDGRDAKSKASLCVKRREARGVRRLNNRLHMKKESLINGSKIKEFNSLLNGEESNQYFIDKVKFNRILNDTIDSIITNKDINKLGIIISKESLLVLGEYYLTHGSLNENITKSVLNIDNSNVIKYIIKLSVVFD